MKLPRLHIDLIFRETSIQHLLKMAIAPPLSGLSGTFENTLRNTYLNLGIEFRKYLSQDEIQIRGEFLESKAKKFWQTIGITGVSHFLGIPPMFGKHCLDIRSGEVKVKFEELLRWRELTHKLGEDLFSCSYLAYHDVLARQDRHLFNWESNLNVYDIRLQNLLGQNLSENHSHLLAAGPVFLPSWISLMNKPKGRKKEFQSAKMLSQSLNPHIQFSPDHSALDLHKAVSIAAIIRYALVQYLNGEKVELSKQIATIFDNQILMDEEIYKTQSEIEILKFQRKSAGAGKIELQEIISDQTVSYSAQQPLLDYVQAPGFEIENATQLESGERWLLYSFFKRLFLGDKAAAELQYWFFIYLLIKAKFRAELVQNNDKIGFYNFLDYQSRKQKLVAKDKGINEHRVKKAVNNHFNPLKYTFTDGRIAVEDCHSVYDLQKFVTGLDKTISAHKGLDKYQYCIHYIKTKDNFPKEESDYLQFSQIPRHAKLREKEKQQTFMIANLRSRKMHGSDRIYAVDGANVELYCRAEVFAQVFRFMKRHSVKEDALTTLLTLQDPKRKTKQLRAKYHVAEEFLDIGDALRAIHESILFLNLGRGDSLAHLVALGTPAKQWYQFKHFRIETRKHDYLDTAVWMMAMIEQYSIDVPRSFFNQLETIFDQYYGEVYLQPHDAQKYLAKIDSVSPQDSITWREYYDAWKLRGDSPDCYSTGAYIPRKHLRYWDRCAENTFEICGKVNRKNPRIAYLYYRYHFDPGVKEKGQEPVFEKVSLDYCHCVEKLQYQFQKEISQRGIFVETLPTSNILIGANKFYEDHPIVRFYSLELETHDRTWPHLHVSINTDDAGVFNTTLENEYALMALALSKAKDEAGNPKYSQETIYRWLSRIRDMGNEQRPNFQP